MRRAALVIPVCLMPALSAALDAPTVSQPGLTIGTSSSIAVMQPPRSLIFATPRGNISIDLRTGGVTMPEGMALDEASGAFWRALRTFTGQCGPSEKQ